MAECRGSPWPNLNLLATRMFLQSLESGNAHIDPACHAGILHKERVKLMK
jgi:hypothetical protein